ncbi:MAG: M61 family peptidase [Candidatus Acidiferrales bacterium]|jgi:predicted metalloprotease with PDZ domain
MMMRLFGKTALLPTSFAVLILAVSAPLRAQMPAPGPIRLEVDATRAPQKILYAHLQMTVQPGPLVLYYPEWIPGEHMPDGPIIDVAGLRFAVGGKTIPWRRDLVDMFAFHLDIPQGASSLDIDLDFLLSAPASGYSAGASATAFLNVLSWNQVVLYPQGYPVRELTFVPSLRLPSGWQFATALPGAKQNGDTVDFSPVSLNTLVDSPVLAGRYFRVVQLTPGETPSHEIDIAADSAAALAMTPETEMHFRRLVAETAALFGVRHYRDYHFLLTLSDDVAHFGLEHHESSDDRDYERSLIDERARVDFADLLPHEFVHSWNGKYRRPADLATPDYQQPMKDDLLWVYEGLTEYLGEVLTARSGLRNIQQSREDLARVAAEWGSDPGRTWRPLQDTADSAPFLYNADADWQNWRRSVDFYEEGELLWLDVDATLRRLTNDQKSMNDFCRIFYGGPGGEPALKTYTFDDIVATLNGLAPYDWAGFLHTRLDSTAPDTPSEAVENSGWKLVYNDQPNEIEENRDAIRKHVTLTFSLGLTVLEDGSVLDVFYGGPSYKAGIGPGMKITAVNGQQYSPETLKDAIDAAKAATAPIRLIVANGSEVETHLVDYHGGLCYPHIERDASRPDYLGEIFHRQAP